MKKCNLCGRKISNTNYTFGLGCLKKICNFTGVNGVKNLKWENLLDKKVLDLSNKSNLAKEQRKALTDRYLTLKLLDEVPLECYNEYKESLNTDINYINSEVNIKNLKSFEVVTLKQAFEINQKYKKYKEVFQDVIDGKYDVIQNITFDVVRFAFNRYYSNKPYLSDIIQLLQYYILKVGVLFLNRKGFNLAAKCLNNSLSKSPKDLTITDSKTVNEIRNDKNFKKCLKKIVEKYGNKSQFNTGEYNESLAFEDGDLFLALHNAYIKVSENKQENNKWNLDITLFDEYDFTDFKEIGEYIEDDGFWKEFIGSTANNLAMIGTACKVVNEYNITIKFKLENWEG